MKQEEKELLLKDLCARLPYGVKCKDLVTDEDITIVGINCIYSNDNPVIISIEGIGDTYLYGIKPYLRPMSSMTEEEYDEVELYANFAGIFDEEEINDTLIEKEARWAEANSRLTDILNKKHFDFRGLIPKGLAIEAPSDMYKFE